MRTVRSLYEVKIFGLNFNDKLCLVVFSGIGGTFYFSKLRVVATSVCYSYHTCCEFLRTAAPEGRRDSIASAMLDQME